MHAFGPEIYLFLLELDQKTMLRISGGGGGVVGSATTAHLY